MMSYHTHTHLFNSPLSGTTWTTVGDGQHLTEGDSHLRGTFEPLQRETVIVLCVVKMQAVEVDAQRHQHTQAYLDELR